LTSPATTGGDVTQTTNGVQAQTASETEIVRDFLESFAAGDLDHALSLLADDVAYTNVSLPTIHGAAAVERLFRRFERRGGHFGVAFHNVAADGAVVMTERTDVLGVGRLRAEFWVCGTFEVHDGRISVWRDYFDWLDITRAFARGALRALTGRR
jgi:limonene-1,2-epoxide hydrolase